MPVGPGWESMEINWLYSLSHLTVGVRHGGGHRPGTLVRGLQAVTHLGEMASVTTSATVGQAPKERHLPDRKEPLSLLRGCL